MPKLLNKMPLMLAQIGVVFVLGLIVYGTIGLAVYLIAEREIRHRGLGGARLGRLFFGAWAVCVAATYVILLLR